MLQWSEVRLTDYVPDGMDYLHDDDYRLYYLDDPEKMLVNEYELLEKHGDDIGTLVWLTESVWLDRDEAEAYGESHACHYNNKKKGVGWRVYGIPANGQLARILRAQDEIIEQAEKEGER